MLIENPVSHVVLLRVNNLSKFRLSPTARIIIRRDMSKVFVIEDHSSRVFEFDYDICLEKFFKQIIKKPLSKHEALKILKPCHKKESKNIVKELVDLGIIW